ncbi:MAG: rhomboid family intramembrane serine protease [Planctomycetes bacterium]|nr:rhomboid family intramembrane serine protease [Planctomycetota bacterium]
MIIPIRTDRPPRRTPLVTQGLIVLNMLVYLGGISGTFYGLFENAGALADFGHFNPQDFKAWQLVTYQFVHDPHGIWHIAFNMVFLWVFGSAVEDRLGRVGYLAFYIAGGAVAALAHAAVSPAPVIGASGSIAGVTGAFLALFPRSRIKILIFFFFVGFVSVPSLWFIGFYMGIDVLRQIGVVLGRGGSNVAYMAHLAGYGYGFSVGFFLLATKLLKREEFDVFFLFTQMRRRAAFRTAGRKGPAGLLDSAQADTGARLARQAADAPAANTMEAHHAELRAKINRLLKTGDLKEAARTYQALLADTSPPAGEQAPEAHEAHDAVISATVLAEQGQLDIASQLYSQGAHADAARAYELLIGNYPTTSRAAEVRLILGLLYARHLDLPQRARELIEQAKPRLHNEAQSKLADTLLAELAT